MVETDCDATVIRATVWIVSKIPRMCQHFLHNLNTLAESGKNVAVHFVL